MFLVTQTVSMIELLVGRDIFDQNWAANTEQGWNLSYNGYDSCFGMKLC